VFVFLYSNWFLLRIYKSIKYVVKQATGTTEIYRLCQSNIGVTSPTPAVITRLDNCILYSSKLADFRRKFLEAPKLSDGQFTSVGNFSLNLVVKLIKLKFPGCQIKDEDKADAAALEMLDSPEGKALHVCLHPHWMTFMLLHDLNARAATRYDPNVPANEKKLTDV
jgi:hypothetical protein